MKLCPTKEKTLPRISIIVPARNEEKFLPSCLASIKNQDYAGEYEIIVVDNGSTDGTAKIARNAGVRIVPCNGKKSVFQARECGSGFAEGDIMVQADADTIYPAGWLKRIAEQFEAHPEAVAIAGKFIYRDPVPLAKVEYSIRHGINRMSAAVCGRPVFIAGANFAFRRQVFLSVNGYRGIAYSADQYGIAGRLARAGKIMYDRKLCVITSSRSVQKPFRLIARDIMLNIPRWSLYLGVYCVGTFIGLVARKPARLASLLKKKD